MSLLSSRTYRASFLSIFLLVVALPGQAAGQAAVRAEGEMPRRIVAIGGAVTEIVYALGAQDRLVAVDSTSRFPADAGRLPNVGYMRQLAAEPILSLAPDLVLMIEDAGPPETIAQLRAAGARIARIQDTPTVAGVIEKVDRIAALLGLEEAGLALAARTRSAHREIGARLAAIPRRPRVLFVLSVGRGAPLAAGEGTAAEGIIALAGGHNALAGFQGYKPLSTEAAIAARPDALLVTRRTLELLGGADELLSRPEFACCLAAGKDRLIAMDGLLLLGFGPRTPDAVKQLAHALHPDLHAH